MSRPCYQLVAAAPGGPDETARAAGQPNGERGQRQVRQAVQGDLRSRGPDLGVADEAEVGDARGAVHHRHDLALAAVLSEVHAAAQAHAGGRDGHDRADLAGAQATPGAPLTGRAGLDARGVAQGEGHREGEREALRRRVARVFQHGGADCGHRVRGGGIHAQGQPRGKGGSRCRWEQREHADERDDQDGGPGLHRGLHRSRPPWP